MGEKRGRHCGWCDGRSSEMGADCSCNSTIANAPENYDLTPRRVQSITDLFRKFDTDADNEIDANELTAVVRSMGHNPTMADIQHMISEADASYTVHKGSKTGTINLDEFITLMTREFDEGNLEIEVRESFKMLDLDADGYISLQTLVRFLSKNNMSDTSGIEELGSDLDAKDRISAEEFVAIIMRKPLPRRTPSNESRSPVRMLQSGTSSDTTKPAT